ncbi:MAG TPA: hypothetical protein VFK85_09895 [Anaeromyxobacteraceae bacterium]|nr:hypothetical protein [Anaeromyxobacteraceae bacterium]
MISTILSIALAATAPARAGTSDPKPPASEGPIVLSTAEQARQLCSAVTPADRLAFQGSAVDRSASGRAHDEEYERALQGRYSVMVPAGQLGFAPYDADEHTLTLWRHAVPTGADGGARLALVEDEGLPVRTDPATARRIVDAQKQGTLALRVTFALAEDEEAPCFAIAGAQASTFAAEPVAWEYVSGDEVLARGGQGGDRPLVSAAQGARPRVELGKPVSEKGGGEVRTTAPDHVRALEGCYTDALKRDPYLDGAIVAALGAGSGPERVKIAADTVQDEAFVGCVRGVLARVNAGGAGRTWLPIHFVLVSPAEAGQQVQQ